MTRLTRRLLLPTVLLAATMPLAVLAQSAWPNRPIKLIVPQGPGSGSDVIARLLGDRMAQHLAQPVVIENAPAANGLVALGSVAKAPADGYTLVLAGVSQLAFNQALYKNLPYDPLKDFTFLAPVADTPFVLVTSNKSGIRNFAQFLEQAKRKNGELSFGSAGIGNSTHIAMELIAANAGVKVAARSLQGFGGRTDGRVVGRGRRHGQCGRHSSAASAIRKGQAIAVMGANRVPHWPELPTLKETGLNVPPMPGWYAIAGPAHLDPKVVATFNAALQKVMADPAVKSKLADMSLTALNGGEQEIRQRAVTDQTFWGAFIRKNNIHID